jgi:uncharacterized protein (TIGR00369 family)
MSRPRPETPEQAIAMYRKVAVEGSGFTRFCGVEPLKVWEGESELLLPLRPDLRQHHGFAHGAVVGMMADNACAWCASSLGFNVVTSSYTINFLNAAKGTRLRSKGQVVKGGKRQIVCRAEVWSESDGEAPVLAAIATATITPLG